MSEETMMDVEEQVELAPAEYTDPQAAPAARRPVTRGTLRYYAVFLGVVLCLVILLLCLMTPLRMLLTQYEAAQPDKTAREIYELLFADPDWALIYDMAEVKATTFEGRSTYVRYMEEKVGDRTLRYVQVAEDVAGEKRYSVRLGREEVASFTTYSYDDGVSTFPLWTLGEVDVAIARDVALTITKLPGQTVYINGVPLDENYTVVYVETLAENYLPGELNGYHYVQQRVEGLLMEPEVVVVDELNRPLPLSHDPRSGTYSTQIPVSPDMTEEERAMIVAAAEAELRFSIRKLSAAGLRQFFETNSQAYTELNDLPPAVEKCTAYSFDPQRAQVTDFYRYDSTAFSARVRAEMDVTLPSGEDTVVLLDMTYIFHENSAGHYTVTDRVDEDLQKVITSVLINYEADGQIVGSFVTDVADNMPAAPMLTDRDGEQFLGWGRLEEDGSLTLVMRPVTTTDFRLVPGQKLTYGTLYPVYGTP